MDCPSDDRRWHSHMFLLQISRYKVCPDIIEESLPRDCISCSSRALSSVEFASNALLNTPSWVLSSNIRDSLPLFGLPLHARGDLLRIK